MATKKILANLDLIQNELQNAVIQVLASDPATGKLGQIYYNSANKALMQYDGAKWNRVGVVYQQDSTTGAVITGLDASGNVTTTNVTGLTLTGYTPVEGGYVTAGMTMQEAMNAMDTAIKNAVAGGGEVNQNAWSNINVQGTKHLGMARHGKDGGTMLGIKGSGRPLVLVAGLHLVASRLQAYSHPFQDGCIAFYGVGRVLRTASYTPKYFFGHDWRNFSALAMSSAWSTSRIFEKGQACRCSPSAIRPRCKLRIRLCPSFIKRCRVGRARGVRA